VTFQAFLELFGANVFGASFFGAMPAIEVVFAAVHLAGAITVACALGVAARRFFRSGDLIVPVFAVAIVLNLGAYMISTHSRDLLGAREMAEVLPLGAVLAGRTLGDRETDDANYDPARHYANFVVADGPDRLAGMQAAAVLTFGRPARIYHADGYTIMAWNTNLLTKLG
jgi:hypothetical protein